MSTSPPEATCASTRCAAADGEAAPPAPARAPPREERPAAQVVVAGTLRRKGFGSRLLRAFIRAQQSLRNPAVRGGCIVPCAGSRHVTVSARACRPTGAQGFFSSRRKTCLASTRARASQLWALATWCTAQTSGLSATPSCPCRECTCDTRYTTLCCARRLLGAVRVRDGCSALQRSSVETPSRT